MLPRMGTSVSSLVKMKVVCCSRQLLTRANVPLKNTQVVRYAKRTRQSSHPKLHHILEYWHNASKGGTQTAKNPEYFWNQGYKHLQSQKLFDSRGWAVQQVVAKHMRRVFCANNRNCDTVFDGYSDPTNFKFRDKIELCKQEEDFRRLELELASTVARYSLRDLVYFMDGFLVHDHRPKDLCSRTLKHLSYCFAQEEKTPSRVLHLLFVIGCSRNVPRELIYEIEQYLCNHVDEYNFGDLTVACFSFFILHQPFSNVTLMDKIAQVALEHFRDRPQTSDVQPLTSIYKMFTLSAYYDARFYTEMGDCLIKVINQLDWIRTPAFMTFIRAYAAAGIKHEDLFAVLLKSVDINRILEGIGESSSLTKHMGTRSKDINRFLWAFGSLKMPVDKVWIQTSLALLSEPDLAKIYPHALVEGLHALTVFDVSPMHLYRKLYDPEFLCRIEDGIKNDSIDFYQLLLLHQYIKLMHPEFRMPVGIETRLKERRTFAQKTDVSLKIKKGLAHVWYTVEQLFGRECVRLTYLVQVSAINDIILHLDKNNRPVPQENQYDEETEDLLDYVRTNIQEYIDEESDNSILSWVIKTHARSGERKLYTLPSLPEPHLLPDKPQRQRKICIRVLSSKQCFQNRPDTLGYVTVENKLIRRMGYEIYLVSPKEADDFKLKSEKERVAYVRDHILRRLNVNTDHIRDTTSPEEVTRKLGVA